MKTTRFLDLLLLLFVHLIVGRPFWSIRTILAANITSKVRSSSKLEPSFFTTRVLMRDGVELAVDYFINTTVNKYPAIVEITPYGRTLSRPNFRNEAGYWMSHGYAFIIADARGTGDSTGEFHFLSYEGKDGYDLVEWIATQSWCNGRVAMRGASYSGTNQWHTARERPPHLACITPSATAGAPMQEVPYRNGAFTLNWAFSWIGQSVNIAYPPAVDPHPDPKMWLQHRPLRTLDVYATGRKLSLYRTFLDHPTYDDYWRSIGLTSTDFANIDIPTLAFTGWFDGTLPGTIENYQSITKYSPRKSDHFLIVGPYTHMSAPDGGYDYLTDQPILSVGEISIPINGLLPGRNMTHEFYDWCLKGGPRPQWSLIRLFIPQSNIWIETTTFPPKQSHELSLFLCSNGHANTIHGDGRLQWTKPDIEQADHYVYDPMNPLFIDMAKTSYEFPVDINEILDKPDVLIYTTENLNKSLTVVGNVTVDLRFSSTTLDTDVVVQVMDVMPDGRSIKLGSGFAGQLRLRYRDGFERETKLVPHENYTISINVNQVGHTFLPGHRIRLAITSSFYPWISANTNTGEPISTDIQPPVIANNTVFYSSVHPSRIRLTVIDTSNHSNISFSLNSKLLLLSTIIFVIGEYLLY